MAQETRDQTLDRSGSFSRLNARAPEFVPRDHGSGRAVFHQHHHLQPPHHVVYQQIPPPITGQFMVPTGPGLYQHHYGVNEYYGEQEILDQDIMVGTSQEKDGFTDNTVQKIVKQVEYYFSDANLATTEHLMRFIAKDPEGYVPTTVVASFKKIKALAPNNSFLADALRTSSKLVVSEDGKKVKREQPITESDIEELQSRIVVAENLPDNHCYQSLMKVFSIVGSVKSIRTCYPQAPNGSPSATNRSSKLDMLFANKLHAFVEYETVEDAGKAIAELNDDVTKWRSGLRVRLLSSCMAPSKQGTGKGRKPGHDSDGNLEEQASTTADQTKVKHFEHNHSTESPSNDNNMSEEASNEKEGVQAKRGKGRGRGGNKGRGRGHYNTNNNNHQRGGTHAVGTPPGHHHQHHHHHHNSDQPPVSKQPPGPRMPDGTKGFSMGRGKPLLSPSLQ